MYPAAMPGEQICEFGRQLKFFRHQRGWSQLGLAHAAGVSPRHVSFIETGRAQPSTEMVLRLASTLGIPLREQNELLVAAGFAPRYPQRSFSGPMLAPMRKIVERLLAQHEPFPGVVLDRYWNVSLMNHAAERLLQPLLDQGPASTIDALLGSNSARGMLENWDEVAWHTLLRLRRDASHAPGDLRLASLVQQLRELLCDVPMPPNLDPSAPLLESRLRLGEHLVRTVSTIASFNAARDVTLDELRVELIFPADSDAEAFFREAAASNQVSTPDSRTV